MGRRGLVGVFVCLALLTSCASDTDQDELERRLLGTAVSICGIECADYDAVEVDCSGDARWIEGRMYHRCRVRYEGLDDPEVSCAALDGTKVKFRELKDCR
jgi:hypothetical protein